MLVLSRDSKKNYYFLVNYLGEQNQKATCSFVSESECYSYYSEAKMMVVVATCKKQRGDYYL